MTVACSLGAKMTQNGCFQAAAGKRRKKFPDREMVGHKLFLPGDPRLKNQTVRQDLYTRRIDIDYFMTVACGLGAKMTQMGAPTPAD